MTGGFRPFRQIGVRERVRNFCLFSPSRSRRFEELRRMGKIPFRSPFLRRREGVEERALEIFSEKVRGNPTRSRGGFPRTQGGDRL